MGFPTFKTGFFGCNLAKMAGLENHLSILLNLNSLLDPNKEDV